MTVFAEKPGIGILHRSSHRGPEITVPRKSDGTHTTYSQALIRVLNGSEVGPCLKVK